MKVIKIPFGGGGLGHGDGAKDGPNAIQKSLKEVFPSESGRVPNFEFEEVKVDNANLSFSHKNIHERILKQKEKAILLGGDHSVTYPSFKAFAQNNKGAGLVIFDAHPDLMDFIKGATSQEDWLKALINEGIVDKDKVIVIGVRNIDSIEREFINEKKLNFYFMKNIFENKIENVCDAVMEKIRSWPSVYLSIDIDAVDPSFAPGTGYREPGGLSSREIIYFVQRLMKLNNIKMCDIVEVDPNRDVADLTSKLAAKLMTELF
jgi:arginase family enzyme